MASEELAKVIAMIKSVPRDPTASVERMRGAMEKVSERVARDVKCEAVSAGGVPAEWIVPPEAADDRIILYLHGGGYVMGCLNTHRAIGRGVAGEGARAGLSHGAGASLPRRRRRRMRRLSLADRPGIQAGPNRHRGRFCRWRTDPRDVAGAARLRRAAARGSGANLAVD